MADARNHNIGGFDKLNHHNGAREQSYDSNSKLIRLWRMTFFLKNDVRSFGET